MARNRSEALAPLVYDRKVQAEVWRIPKGKVSTYGDIAKAAGFPRTARRVAVALRHATPGLPWHRVVGSGGRILLRGESALEQRMRLEAEGVTFRGGRVWMSAHAVAARRRR